MNYSRFLALLLSAISCHLTSQAQVNWYTNDVRRVLGYVVTPGTPASPPPFRTKVYQLPNCRIASAVVALFDTTATYAQGRVVDASTHRPIKTATIQVSYNCFGREELCEVKTAVTDSAGFFRLGWVGCAGPASGRANRPLQIKAAGYPMVSTQEVDFGGAAYLHIELAARKR